MYSTGVGSGGGGKGGMSPHFFDWGGGQWYVCAPPPPPRPLLTPHFYFPLELYVYITLTNNYLAFFIYQLIILWTISINWHRWLLVNNHISKYNLFILVLYRRYINYVSVCPPTFWHLPTPLLYVCTYVCMYVCMFVFTHTHTHTHTHTPVQKLSEINHINNSIFIILFFLHSCTHWWSVWCQRHVHSRRNVVLQHGDWHVRMWPGVCNDDHNTQVVYHTIPRPFGGGDMRDVIRMRPLHRLHGRTQNVSVPRWMAEEVRLGILGRSQWPDRVRVGRVFVL